MMDLQIAGLPLCIESGHKEWANNRYAAYLRDDDRPSEMNIKFEILDKISKPQGELIEQVKYASILKLPDGRLCRYNISPKGQLFLATYYNEDHSDITIQLLDSQNHPFFSNQDWEYMLSGASFRDRMTVLGCGVLHASSLSWRGHGIAFSANSGTGKSTHVGLWKQCFGDEVTIVNDDKPAITFPDGKPMLCGTPWSGKSNLNANVQVPLDAIVFIERGTENSIRRLDSLESYFNLAAQIWRPYYDASVGEKMMDFAEHLMATVPIYGLTCNISQEAVETVVKEIFPQEEI